MQLVTGISPRLHGYDLQPGTGAHGGQRFPPEAQGGQAVEVFLLPDLGGRVAFTADSQVFTPHAVAVVNYPDPGNSPILYVWRCPISP